MDQEKLLTAIECIIKDTEGKYDECMIEKILTHIKNNSKAMSIDVFNIIKPYTDSKDLSTFNTTRLFKIFDSFLHYEMVNDDNFYKVVPYLESLWNSIHVVFAQKDSSALRVLLTTFNYLVKSPKATCSSCFCWLVDKVIQPSIKVASLPNAAITDIVSLAKITILVSNNYHTRNAAERLFQGIAFATLIQQPHRNVSVIRRDIKELMIDNSLVDLCGMLDSLYGRSRLEDFRCSFCEIYGIAGMLEDKFSVIIEQPTTNINNVCKCLAMLESSKNIDSRLRKLKSKNRIEGIISYVANSDRKNNEFEQLILIYLLYPLLAKCDGEDTQQLIKRLLITRDERNFIDKLTHDRTITLCLVSLKAIYQKLNQDAMASSPVLSQRTSMLVIQIITNFISCNYNLAHRYKNVMLSCEVLHQIWTHPFLFAEKDLDDFQSVINIICAIQDVTEQTKPILMKLIGILRKPTRNFAQFHKVIDLAFKFSDHDIINDFADLLITKEFNFSVATETEVRNYVKLIWEHMYLNAKDTDHRELLGNLAHLLITIDLEVPAKILDEHDIRRYHDIPRILGDILKERSPIHPTVERIIDVLAPKWLSYEHEHKYTTFDRTKDYLSRLDSPTLPTTVQKNLDNLVQGLCITIKGEASDGHRLRAMYLITELAKEIVINCDDAKRIVERLIRNKILETLHEVSVGHLNSSKMIERARQSTHFLATNARLSKKGDLIVEKFKLAGKNDKEAKRIASTFIEEPKYQLVDSDFRAHDETRTENTISISSLLDSIIDFDLTAEKISECY